MMSLRDIRSPGLFKSSQQLALHEARAELITKRLYSYITDKSDVEMDSAQCYIAFFMSLVKSHSHQEQ